MLFVGQKNTKNLCDLIWLLPRFHPNLYPQVFLHFHQIKPNRKKTFTINSNKPIQPTKQSNNNCDLAIMNKAERKTASKDKKQRLLDFAQQPQQMVSLKQQAQQLQQSYLRKRSVVILFLFDWISFLFFNGSFFFLFLFLIFVY